MWHWFKQDEYQKLESLHSQTVTEPLLQPFFSMPLPERDEDIRCRDTLVLDFETSGFDSQTDQVLSMGWVTITHGQIQLKTARHILIANHHKVNPEAAKVHHLLPEKLNKQGVSLVEAFSELLLSMQGKVLVAHGCVIEKSFIQAYLQRHYGIEQLPILWIDTLKIEQKRQALRKDRPDFRLAAVRKRYGLPEYMAHHALVDAVATAELYLAQLHGLFAQEKATVHSLLTFSQR
ncbi:exonuclease domain-containing protein [Vibrio tritonius]|uniref:3'-5' exonuclease n=1 Tax=Vibrio tritonius TaxID=1435069 RepID=UPI00315CA7DE